MPWSRYVTCLGCVTMIASMRYATIWAGVVGAVVIAGIAVGTEYLERTFSRGDQGAAPSADHELSSNQRSFKKRRSMAGNSTSHNERKERVTLIESS
jgi:hypothetical protein